MKEMSRMKHYIQVNRALKKLFLEQKQKEIELYGDKLTEKRFTKTYHYSEKNPTFISMGKLDKYIVYYFEHYVFKVFYYFNETKQYHNYINTTHLNDKNVKVEIINKKTKETKSFFIEDTYAFEEHFDFEIMLRGYGVVLADNENWKAFKEEYEKYHNGEYEKVLNEKYDAIETAKTEYRNLYDTTCDNIFATDEYKGYVNEMNELTKTFKEETERLKKEYNETYNKLKNDRANFVNKALDDAKVNEKDQEITKLREEKTKYINTYSTTALREKYGIKHSIYTKADFDNILEI